MQRWIGFFFWLIVAAVGLTLGLTSEAGFGHAWLSLALVAVFVASEGQNWSVTKRKN